MTRRVRQGATNLGSKEIVTLINAPGRRLPGAHCSLWQCLCPEGTNFLLGEGVIYNSFTTFYFWNRLNLIYRTLNQFDEA
jgi:hypothetical protein